MEILTAVGYLLLLLFIPLVAMSYWLLQSLALAHMREVGFLTILLYIFVTLIGLLVFSMCAAKMYSAIQDGVISCIDTNRGSYGDCKSSYELHANPLEFWITLAVQYLLTIGSLVMAISSFDLTMKNTIRKT